MAFTNRNGLQEESIAEINITPFVDVVLVLLIIFMITAGVVEFGLQIEIRCWESVDARKARPTRLPWETLEKIAGRIIEKIPGVVSVTYNIAAKPPSTIEAV